MIPSISPLSPGTTWGPLIFVLAVSAIKDAIEDIIRWRSDSEVNNREYEVLRDGKFSKLRNKEIKVGDVVCIHRDEEAPADAVILLTSDDDGIAYVDTANLDGETNLKPYKARPETKTLSYRQLKRMSARISATVNNANLYKFQGNLEIMPNNRFEEAYAAGDDDDSDSDDETSPKPLELPGHNQAEMEPLKHKKKGSKDGVYPYYGQKLPLDEKNLLLRGARLRNTKYCYAGIVYAGLETKMQLNANSPPSKFSMTDTLLNRVVIIVFCFKILACAGCAIASTLFEAQFAPRGSLNYLPTNDSPVWRGFLSFWSYFAVFSVRSNPLLTHSFEPLGLELVPFMTPFSTLFLPQQSIFLSTNTDTLCSSSSPLHFLFSIHSRIVALNFGIDSTSFPSLVSSLLR